MRYTSNMNDFDYLGENDVYLDSACQSLRPRPVIDALNRYYKEHNSCGERVKYAWGRRTDELVENARLRTLKYLKLRPRDYFVSFTLNTTYGLNLLLSQLRPGLFDKVMTSDIEHNSPFLSTMSFSKRMNIPREIITRTTDGSIPLEKRNFSRALVVVNCVSNVDGRTLPNLKDLVKAVHKAKGLIIIDAAQAFGHNAELLYKTEADAICTSSHKSYGPSLGVMVVRRDLLPKLETSFIGGGMVDDVTADTYQLSAESPNHAYTKLEAGLQAWGEIIAFSVALDWLEALPRKTKTKLADHSARLYSYLESEPRVRLLGSPSSPTMSFFIDGLDSHLVGEALSDAGIMARTGYFCVHYYLDHVLHYPPLVRFSLGYHTRESDLDQTINTLKRMLK